MLDITFYLFIFGPYEGSYSLGFVFFIISNLNFVNDSSNDIIVELVL
jgi:hypothetical protein